MELKKDLTQGSVYKGLLNLSIPIMATSFIQMSYNLMDLIWIGRIKDNPTAAVAAVGTIGLLIWLANVIVIIPRIGAEVGLANSIGGRDDKKYNGFLFNSLYIDIILSFFYMMIIYFFKNNILHFFNLDSDVFKYASDYLQIMNYGMIFVFLNPLLSGIFNGSGNSKIPFFINSIGLVFNIVLDYLLIFGYKNIPSMGVKGAAIASVIAQAVVTFIFLILFLKRDGFYRQFFNFKQNFSTSFIKKIFQLGGPPTIHNIVFVFISSYLTRIIAYWGAGAITAQKIGIQIEAITWMTAEGFATALSTYIAQSYGAKKIERVKEIYKKGMIIVATIGFVNMFLLYFKADSLFKIFIPDGGYALNEGIRLLKILSVSEVFLSVEIATSGAFNGLGDTKIPAIFNIIINAIRIPIAILTYTNDLGLYYIWWGISLTCICKGIVFLTLFIKKLRNLEKEIG